MVAEPFWTDDRLARMDEMIADGASAREIAENIGATRSAVLGKIQRTKRQLANQRRKTTTWHNGNLNKLREWFEEGLTDQTMASRFRTTPAAIRTQRQRLGLKRPRSGWFDVPPGARKSPRAPKGKASGPERPVNAPRRGSVTIQNVTLNQCRFPVWDDDETTTAASPLCGAPTAENKVYCPFHCDKAYRDPRSFRG